jgi:hypothetical protein
MFLDEQRDRRRPCVERTYPSAGEVLRSEARNVSDPARRIQSCAGTVHADLDNVIAAIG